MRCQMKTALALALLAGLAWAGLVHAQDDRKAGKGNWFTRLFTGDKKDAESKKDDKKKAVEPTGPSLQEIHAQARKDWLRRQLLCLRLSEIAMETGDPQEGSCGVRCRMKLGACSPHYFQSA